MRTLIIVASLATLIGCSCPAPRTVSESCTSRACLDRIGAPIDLKPTVYNPKPATIKAKFAKAKKVKPAKVALKPPSAQPLIAAPPQAPTPAQPSARPDPVLKKAEATIAAKMEDSAFASGLDR